MNRGPKRLVCSASAQYEWTGNGSGSAIRFLATDLDGTLLTSEKRITAHTKRIIIDAQNRGLTVILASGRPLYSILPLPKTLNLTSITALSLPIMVGSYMTVHQGKRYVSTLFLPA